MVEEGILFKNQHFEGDFFGGATFCQFFPNTNLKMFLWRASFLEMMISFLFKTDLNAFIFKSVVDFSIFLKKQTFVINFLKFTSSCTPKPFYFYLLVTIVR